MRALVAKRLANTAPFQQPVCIEALHAPLMLRCTVNPKGKGKCKCFGGAACTGTLGLNNACIPQPGIRCRPCSAMRLTMPVRPGFDMTLS